jgi:hypothetical protein
MARTRVLFLAAIAVLVVAPLPLPAQARSLSWPEITVAARLDAEGRLRVRERQVMRFTGDWNGGQRSFDTGFGQEFWFLRLSRIDSTTGEPRPLVQGDLDRVDGYDWADRNMIRWRSRLPSDPPFDGTEITYELEFLYGNILQAGGDAGYLLDHDFSFSNREGPISRFALTLEIDSAWQTPPDFDGRYVASDLQPGRGFVVTVPLTRVATTRPEAVRFGADPGIRQGLLAVLVIGFVALLVRLIRREARIGRFAPLTPRSEIDTAWLEYHVFAHLPEVVGAAWDDHTSAPEVAATLARLVQERKVTSTVETKKVLFFSSHVLHLRLNVSRNHLQQHERALIDALFDPGEDSTNTERVRKRYSKTGFDPASVIKSRLKELADARTPEAPKGSTPSRIPTVVLCAVAIVLIAAGVRENGADLGVAAVVMAASLPVYLVSVAFAHAWRGRVSRLAIGSLGFLLPLGALTAAFTILLLVRAGFATGAFVLAGLTVWILALTNSVFNIARSRQSPERIGRRKLLASAREFFRAELAKPRPALRDEWFPYALAFGLGRHIDRWFDAFGGEERGMARSAGLSSGARGSGGSSGNGGGTWTGFGGGGGFGGAGGGASFGAALGGMASSISSPSSGGSSGGGGGGGSSGGGGGGGW